MADFDKLDEDFKKTQDDALTNAEWDRYDKVIKTELDQYKVRLGTTPGFKEIPFNLVKAVLWIESGGPMKWSNAKKALVANPEWKTRPMQIGVGADQGLPTLEQGREATLLVMSDALRQELPKVRKVPEVNVRAGIAYLVNRQSESEIKDVMDSNDTKLYEYTIKKGDTFATLAPR